MLVVSILYVRLASLNLNFFRNSANAADRAELMSLNEKMLVEPLEPENVINALMPFDFKILYACKLIVGIIEVRADKRARCVL